jgi:hypothetical protein
VTDGNTCLLKNIKAFQLVGEVAGDMEGCRGLGMSAMEKEDLGGKWNR